MHIIIIRDVSILFFFSKSKPQNDFKYYLKSGWCMLAKDFENMNNSLLFSHIHTF